MNPFRKLSIIMATVSILFATSCASFKDKPMTREQKIAYCRTKLHKVTSRDDLIKQMYETAYLDDCLYEMQPEELQSIWGVKVRDERLTTNGWTDPESPFNLYVSYFNESYQPESTNYGIRLNDNVFDTIGTLFPEGKFPDFLPEPLKEKMRDDQRYGRSTSYHAKEGDFIQHGWDYFWIYDNRVISTTGWFRGGAIPDLMFFKHKRAFYPYAYYPSLKMKK